MSRSFALLGALMMLVACTSPTVATLSDGGDDDGGPETSSCSPCTASSDCSLDQVCAQLENDNFCLEPCLFSTDCADGFTCTLLTTFNGQSISACAANSGACGQLPPGSTAPDGGTGTGPTPDGYCGALAGPNVSNTNCTCKAGQTCAPNNCYGGWYCDTNTDKCVNPPNPESCGPTIVDGGTTTTTPDAGQSGYCGTLAGPFVSGTGCHCGKPGQCAANNCYGGWYCDTTDNKCVAPPSNCTPTTPDAGTPVPDAGFPHPDGGTVVTGPIDAHNGGTASDLYFAVVGDTRPANNNDTAGYPTAVIQGIYAAIARLNPAPLFVLGTGDYQFASPNSGQNDPQIQLYMQARSQWGGIFWPAMGNHECTGATRSNCCPGCTDGITTNFTSFQSAMLTPIGESLPYFTRNVNATDGSWTAKFIFAAPNYWDSTQQSWYQQQLAQSTTYTFIVDHEYQGSGSPGDSTVFSDAQSVPHTIHVVGHTHTWEQHSDTVVIGNGGAPITGGAPYGFTTFHRRASDGAIVITGYDYTSGSAAPGEQFCVSPTGSSVGQCP